MPTSPPPTPPGTVTAVAEVMNKKHQVTSVSLTFGGGVDPSAASNKANYQLIKQGKHRSFIATKAATIPIKSVSYNPSSNTVALIPRKPFALSKPVEVLFQGLTGSVVQTALGRTIVDNRNGQAGGNVIAILSNRGATPAVVAAPAAIATADAVDVLLAQSDADGLLHTRSAAWLRGGRKSRS
jgi:hypothetical protein